MAAGDAKQRLQEFSVSPPREHVVSTIFALSIERMQSCVFGGAKERTWYLIVQAHHWQKGVTHHSRREYFGRGHREHYTPHSPAPPPSSVPSVCWRPLTQTAAHARALPSRPCLGLSSKRSFPNGLSACWWISNNECHRPSSTAELTCHLQQHFADELRRS